MTLRKKKKYLNKRGGGETKGKRNWYSAEWRKPGCWLGRDWDLAIKCDLKTKKFESKLHPCRQADFLDVRVNRPRGHCSTYSPPFFCLFSFLNAYKTPIYFCRFLITKDAATIFFLVPSYHERKTRPVLPINSHFGGNDQRISLSVYPFFFKRYWR